MRNPKFIGVYSKNGSGAAKGGALARGPLYFVWKLADLGYAVQELDKSFLPRGGARRLTEKQLNAGFRFEPSILVAPVTTPDFRHLEVAENRSPGFSEAVELNDDTLRELEIARKAKQVEADMRNNFNKAMRALSRPRDRRGALAALEQLAGATKGITPLHKHMFRDFGVSLRKKSLPDLALLYARRTVDLAPDDDHAHFNMARILAIMGRFDEANAHLRRAMSIDGSEKVYERMLNHIRKERGIPASGKPEKS